MTLQTISVADKGTLDVVKTLLGETTDTGGSSTEGSTMGKLNSLIEALNNLNSGGFTVQRGVIAYNSNTTLTSAGDTQFYSTGTNMVSAKFVDLTISSVDISKSFVNVYSPSGMYNGSYFNYNVCGRLIDSNTLRIYANNGYSYIVQGISWEVITSN